MYKLGLSKWACNAGVRAYAPRLGQCSRMLSTSRPLFNQKNESAPAEDKSNSEDTMSRGVKDPGTARHGYDPTKPRKPLSRIAIGGKNPVRDPGKGREQARTGMLSWKAAVMFLATGGALTYYFNEEKKRIDAERKAEENRGIGKPQVGGPFNLVDQDGNKFTEKDLLGKFSLIYFGFSMCPDICPEELEKMVEVLGDFNTKDKQTILPVFITCDPNRDSPEVLKEYLAEFDPSIVGLTGTYNDIKETCKAYRVYFSTPPDLKPGQDYLVDHSIFFYLMDPEGKFVDALGRNYDVQQTKDIIKAHISQWKPSSEREKPKGFLW